MLAHHDGSTSGERLRILRALVGLVAICTRARDDASVRRYGARLLDELAGM